MRKTTTRGDRAQNAGSLAVPDGNADFFKLPI